MDDDLGCPFRLDVRSTEFGETATCEFLRRLTDADPQFCSVDRSACEVCVQTAPLSPASLNPVMPSLLFGVTEAAFPDAAESSPAGALKSWAQRTVENDGRDALVAASHACDAVLVWGAEHSLESVLRAARSALHQNGMHVYLHLVCDGQDASLVPGELTSAANVFVHAFTKAHGTWQRVSDVLPQLQTPYLAVVDPNSLCLPDRFYDSIDALDRSGNEFFAAAEIGFDAPQIKHESSQDDHSLTIQASTLLMRRSALIDAGGIDPSSSDGVQEFVTRAVRQNRLFEISDVVVLQRFGRCDRAIREVRVRIENTEADPARANLRLTNRNTNVRCDVVLPFRDGFDFVQQSMDGLLNQRSADIVIHLVDDASEQSAEAILNRYRDLEQVRTYRNNQNLGPFATFNNICEFAETGLIAVQDADDISLPDRIAHSCRLLHASGADLVAGATELFGDPQLVSEICFGTLTTSNGEKIAIRRSRYPDRRTCGYYLENPTLVMRTDKFIALGGYGDFGEGKRNRTGVDTDFQLRAYYARASIAITQDILLRYRCHGESATNHKDSGMGSRANLESHQEVSRRFRCYAQGSFSPTWFGAIGRHRGVTRRI